MNKQTLYTELSIQIATLEAKVDKILQLLMEPEIEVISLGSRKDLDKSDDEYFGEVYNE